MLAPATAPSIIRSTRVVVVTVAVVVRVVVVVTVGAVYTAVAVTGVSYCDDAVMLTLYDAPDTRFGTVAVELWLLVMFMDCAIVLPTTLH